MPVKSKKTKRRAKRVIRAPQTQVATTPYSFIPASALQGQEQSLAFRASIRNLEAEQKELLKKLQESEFKTKKSLEEAQKQKEQQVRTQELTKTILQERISPKTDDILEERAIRYSLNDKSEHHRNDPRQEEIVIDLDEPITQAVSKRGRPKKYYRDTVLTEKEAKQVSKDWGVEGDELYDLISANFGLRE